MITFQEYIISSKSKPSVMYHRVSLLPSFSGKHWYFMKKTPHILQQQVTLSETGSHMQFCKTKIYSGFWANGKPSYESGSAVAAGRTRWTRWGCCTGPRSLGTSRWHTPSPFHPVKKNTFVSWLWALGSFFSKSIAGDPLKNCLSTKFYVNNILSTFDWALQNFPQLY